MGWGRMPHSMKASSSSFTNRRSSAPVIASLCAMRLHVLLRQAVQGGLLMAVALVVERGVRCRPPCKGPSTGGVHNGLP